MAGKQLDYKTVSVVEGQKIDKVGCWSGLLVVAVLGTAVVVTLHSLTDAAVFELGSAASEVVVQLERQSFEMGMVEEQRQK